MDKNCLCCCLALSRCVHSSDAELIFSCIFWQSDRPFQRILSTGVDFLLPFILTLLIQYYIEVCRVSAFCRLCPEPCQCAFRAKIFNLPAESIRLFKAVLSHQLSDDRLPRFFRSFRIRSDTGTFPTVSQLVLKCYDLRRLAHSHLVVRCYPPLVRDRGVHVCIIILNARP